MNQRLVKLCLFPIAVAVWLLWRRHESPYIGYPVRCAGGSRRICIGCGWIGFDDDCLDWKHPIGARMCPECYDNTEIYADAKG